MASRLPHLNIQVWIKKQHQNQAADDHFELSVAEPKSLRIAFLQMEIRNISQPPLARASIARDMSMAINDPADPMTLTTASATNPVPVATSSNLTRP
jgi:hypothetical protein